mmetsp:Transcript_39897/g.55460  ORF Transcript_39897/g.55460 Transcript_39897/m.55460 type:complete len:325 (-) Transcript_39897:310-1284(-)
MYSKEGVVCATAGFAVGVGVTYALCRKFPMNSNRNISESIIEVIAETPSDILGSIPRSTASSGVSKGGGPAIYESQRAVQEYLCFHFLTGMDLVPYSCAPREALDFTKRCAQLCKKHACKNPQLALDLGCAVGGQSFELTRHFQEVIGIDFSHAFVDAANMMRDKKKTTIFVQEEGELMVEKTVGLPSGINAGRARFIQGDACNLPKSHFGPFDCILAANLLCRLPDPRALLNRLPTLVNTGGIVVFVSPYSWLEEYTPKELWLGGKENEGKPVMSNSTLKHIMSGLNFSLVEEADMPFLIREHARKFQWGCSHATVWRFKGKR